MSTIDFAFKGSHLSDDISEMEMDEKHFQVCQL